MTADYHVFTLLIVISYFEVIKTSAVNCQFSVFKQFWATNHPVSVSCLRLSNMSTDDFNCQQLICFWMHSFQLGLFCQCFISWFQRTTISVWSNNFCEHFAFLSSVVYPSFEPIQPSHLEYPIPPITTLLPSLTNMYCTCQHTILWIWVTFANGSKAWRTKSSRTLRAASLKSEPWNF